MPAKFVRTRAGEKWASDVAAGRKLACKWTRLACQRHLDDLEKAKGGWRYRFDREKAERVIRFIELLPHTKGKWAKAIGAARLIKLEPWQLFITACIFGWVWKETGLRRFTLASIFIARKNGKSVWAAAIGLYMLVADNEFGAEVYAGATSRVQAWEVFRPAKLMASGTMAFRDFYGVEVHASKIVKSADQSRFEPVIGKPGDGASPHCAITDEYHEHKTDDQVETMETGMGAREQALSLKITTAGDNTAGPCYQHQKECQQMLDGRVNNDHLFAIIFTVDDPEKWDNKTEIRKANPNYGISVIVNQLEQQLREAKQSARKQSRFKTKRLSIWVGAMDAFFNLDHWTRVADPGLAPEQFAGEECWTGLDLASKIDVTAAVKVFKRLVDGEWHYYVFGRFYLPKERLKDKVNDGYEGWGKDGYLTLTDGNVIDFAQIRDDIVDDAADFDMAEIPYDPWGATQLAQELENDHGLTPVELAQTTKNLSEPMKWVEALLKDQRLHHDGNPVMTWMIGNVVSKTGRNDTEFPNKERADDKIDGAVALIMAINRAMAEEEDDDSITIPDDYEVMSA